MDINTAELIPFLEILIACSTDRTVISTALFSKCDGLTCANHGDRGLYINPLVRVDARVDKD